MGLWSFLFGPREPSDQGELEEEEKHPHLRHVGAEDRVARLHEQVSRQEIDSADEKGTPRLWGFERAAGRLAQKVRHDQLKRWHNISGKLDKLERTLGSAESAEDLRRAAKRAVSPHGIFRKIERGMEKRLEDLAPGERRRYTRDLRRLERRLRNPSRFIRF